MSATRLVEQSDYRTATPPQRSAPRRALRWIYLLISRLFVDPIQFANQLRALPTFLGNWRAYSRSNRHDRLRPSVREVWYRSYDRYAEAGSFTQHYFHQDLWAARLLHKNGVTNHVDVGSRVDGFIAHALLFARVCYVDIRPFSDAVDGLEYRQGSITALPFADDSVPSLSSLHVIEHIGLGRYGDPIDPDGHVRAAAELSRVLQPGGRLLVSTPVGRERLCFDAHRVFDPYTIVDMFGSLTLSQFGMIDDKGKLHETATLDQGRACEYGCGLFVFTKQPKPVV